LLALGLLGAAGFVLAGSSRLPSVDESRDEVRGACHQAVLNALQPGIQTAFSSDAETRIESLPDDKSLISGWVDLIAADGSARRNVFTCTIHKNQADEWALDDVSLIPQ
jgi:hypothetical protein